jgi:hypothetical protein
MLTVGGVATPVGDLSNAGLYQVNVRVPDVTVSR